MDDSAEEVSDRVALGMFLRLRTGPVGSTHLGRALLKVNEGDLAAVLGHLLVRIEQLEHRLEHNDSQ